MFLAAVRRLSFNKGRKDFVRNSLTLARSEPTSLLEFCRERSRQTITSRFRLRRCCSAVFFNWRYSSSGMFLIVKVAMRINLTGFSLEPLWNRTGSSHQDQDGNPSRVLRLPPPAGIRRRMVVGCVLLLNAPAGCGHEAVLEVRQTSNGRSELHFQVEESRASKGALLLRFQKRVHAPCLLNGGQPFTAGPVAFPPTPDRPFQRA